MYFAILSILLNILGVKKMFIILNKGEKEFVTVEECSKKYPDCNFILLNPQGEGEALRGELYCIADEDDKSFIMDTLDYLDKEGKYFSLYYTSKIKSINYRYLS